MGRYWLLHKRRTSRVSACFCCQIVTAAGSTGPYLSVVLTDLDIRIRYLSANNVPLPLAPPPMFNIILPSLPYDRRIDPMWEEEADVARHHGHTLTLYDAEQHKLHAPLHPAYLSLYRGCR